MNNTLALISAFLGGALAGAGAAILFAPEKGEELRGRIVEILRRRGLVCKENDVDAIVEQLTQELAD